MVDEPGGEIRPAETLADHLSTAAPELAGAGRIDPSALVGQRIPLSGVGAALSDMDARQPPGITVIDDLGA